MTTFMFWNINKNKGIARLLSQAVVQFDVNVLLIAECKNTDQEILREINSGVNSLFIPISYNSEKIRIFINIQKSNHSLIQSDLTSRVSVRKISLESGFEILLATVHLLSKYNASEQDQTFIISTSVMSLIRESEQSSGHSNTIVVGDFNQNPFETGLISAAAFHAVMSKKIADKKPRVYQGKAYDYFYNPMWAFFGDRTGGPPGTYYHGSPDLTDTYWHILDQVLLRPSMVPHLGKVSIVDRIGTLSLLTASAETPCDSVGSDHLPLLFTLNL